MASQPNFNGALDIDQLLHHIFCVHVITYPCQILNEVLADLLVQDTPGIKPWS